MGRMRDEGMFSANLHYLVREELLGDLFEAWSTPCLGIGGSAGRTCIFLPSEHCVVFLLLLSSAGMLVILAVLLFLLLFCLAMLVFLLLLCLAGMMEILAVDMLVWDYWLLQSELPINSNEICSITLCFSRLSSLLRERVWNMTRHLSINIYIQYWLLIG